MIKQRKNGNMCSRIPGQSPFDDGFGRSEEEIKARETAKNDKALDRLVQSRVSFFQKDRREAGRYVGTHWARHKASWLDLQFIELNARTDDWSLNVKKLKESIVDEGVYSLYATDEAANYDYQWRGFIEGAMSVWDEIKDRVYGQSEIHVPEHALEFSEEMEELSAEVYTDEEIEIIKNMRPEGGGDPASAALLTDILEGLTDI
jgi:hypothetical protein